MRRKLGEWTADCGLGRMMALLLLQSAAVALHGETSCTSEEEIGSKCNQIREETLTQDLRLRC